METKLENIQFVASETGATGLPVATPRALPVATPRALPVVVALARTIMRPVQSYGVLRLPGVPQRLALVRYTPWGAADPIIPVPLVDFGSVFFDGLGRFAEQLDSWRRTDQAGEQRRWSKTGYNVLTNFTMWLDENGNRIGMTVEERAWLVTTLWRLWADPSAQEILAEARSFAEDVRQMKARQERFGQRNGYLLGNN